MQKWAKNCTVITNKCIFYAQTHIIILRNYSRKLKKRSVTKGFHQVYIQKVFVEVVCFKVSPREYFFSFFFFTRPFIVYMFVVMHITEQIYQALGQLVLQAFIYQQILFYGWCLSNIFICICNYQLKQLNSYLYSTIFVTGIQSYLYLLIKRYPNIFIFGFTKKCQSKLI